MFESTEVDVLQQCTFLLVIIINVRILLYVTQHLVYLNQKANLEIIYRSGFDWVVLVAWKKSHFTCICTIRWTHMTTYMCLRVYTTTRNSLKNCTWRLGNARANMSWSLAHHDTAFSNSLIFAPAALPHSAQREQLVNIVFHCCCSVGDPVISLLHIILIPSLGKNYHSACPYLELFEYMRPVILLPIAEEVKVEFDLEYNVKKRVFLLCFPCPFPISTCLNQDRVWGLLLPSHLLSQPYVPYLSAPTWLQNLFSGAWHKSCH